jgi:hypothetical protein
VFSDPDALRQFIADANAAAINAIGGYTAVTLLKFTCGGGHGPQAEPHDDLSPLWRTCSRTRIDDTPGLKALRGHPAAKTC